MDSPLVVGRALLVLDVVDHLLLHDGRRRLDDQRQLLKLVTQRRLRLYAAIHPSRISDSAGVEVPLGGAI